MHSFLALPSAQQAAEIRSPCASGLTTLFSGKEVSSDLLFLGGAGEVQRGSQLLVRPSWDPDSVVQLGATEVCVEVLGLKADRGLQSLLSRGYLKALGERDPEGKMTEERPAIERYRLPQENDRFFDPVTLQSLDSAHEKPVGVTDDRSGRLRVRWAYHGCIYRRYRCFHHTTYLSKMLFPGFMNIQPTKTASINTENATCASIFRSSVN